MSLLTPSESHAFQSFLSAIDYDSHSLQDQIFNPEWAFLPDDIDLPTPPPGKEALTKATKDLMALEQQHTFSPSYSSWSIPSLATSQRPQTAHSAPSPLSPNSPAPTQLAHPQPHSTTTTTTNNTNPFFLFHQRRASSAAYHEPPIPTATHPHALMLSTSSSSSTSYAPTTSPPPLSSKRSHSSDSTSSHPSTSKRRRPSSPGPPRSLAQASPPAVPIGGGGKPPLLSASQKKANHIQSEQKRRANIRRGYEALCETVPALREAIRLEDEAMRAAAEANGGVLAKKRKSRNKGSSGNGSGASGGANGNGNGEEGGDKADGRAGPRSENIVLQKTVDYIQEMLSEKQQLLARLQRAQGALPPDHPALTTATTRSRDGNGVAVWDREWTGGTGVNDDNSSDEDE